MLKWQRGRWTCRRVSKYKRGQQNHTRNKTKTIRCKTLQTKKHKSKMQMKKLLGRKPTTISRETGKEEEHQRRAFETRRVLLCWYLCGRPGGGTFTARLLAHNHSRLRKMLRAFSHTPHQQSADAFSRSDTGSNTAASWRADAGVRCGWSAASITLSVRHVEAQS